MAGWFELSRSANGQHRFVLKAGNNEVILRSEQYKTRGSAKNGIAAVQKNSASTERYARKTAADGRTFFNLRAGNNQVIGSSQLYASPETRDAGIESVRANGVSTEVREIS